MKFLADMPKGPLDKYRKLASFNWKEMSVAMEEEDVLKFKHDLWDRMAKDPLFQRTCGAQTMDEQRRLANLRMRRLKEWDVLPMKRLRNLRKIMAFNVACLSYGADFYVKHSLAYGFVQNTLIGLGAGEHDDLYNELSNPKTEIVGSFSLTEIAHGSNTKAMRTTATFIPETQEFEIHTPDFEAAKCWVGNLGKTSTHTIVFAQLITPDGNNNGLHGFIVPIRDPVSLRVYPGLTIGDLGEKIGLVGVDNGFIMFNKYRVPKKNLLSKTGKVNPEGKYVTPFKDPKKKLGASLGALSAGRVAIVGIAATYLSDAVIIATRYSAVRKQFGPTDGEEIPIIEYPLLQWRLFPYIAVTYAFKYFSGYFYDALIDSIMKSFSADDDEKAATGPEMHALSSAAKPLAGWLARDGIQECREICAGHGFLSVSRFGELRGNNDGNLTYEGDNNVLIQQTSNWLLQLWNQRDKVGTWDTPLGTIAFLNNWRTIQQDRAQILSPGEIVHPENSIRIFEWLLLYLLQITYNKHQKISKREMNDFNVKNNIQVYHAKPLSLVYAELTILRKFYEFAASQENKSIKEVLMKLVSLYGAWSVEKHSCFLYEGGYITSSEVSASLKQGIINLCESLKGEAVSLVDAIAPPDFILNSPLGCADGEIYKHLQAVLFHSPETFSIPSWLKNPLNEKSKL